MLKEIDEAQNYLQSKEISLAINVIKIKALSNYLKTDRERLVDQALHKAQTKCDEYDIATLKRQRFKNERQESKYETQD